MSDHECLSHKAGQSHEAVVFLSDCIKSTFALIQYPSDHVQDNLASQHLPTRLAPPRCRALTRLSFLPARATLSLSISRPLCPSKEQRPPPDAPPHYHLDPRVSAWPRTPEPHPVSPAPGGRARGGRVPGSPPGQSQGQGAPPPHACQQKSEHCASSQGSAPYQELRRGPCRDISGFHCPPLLPARVGPSGQGAACLSSHATHLRLCI